MDKLSILRYICSYDLDYGISNEELYKAQKQYFSQSIKCEIHFDPLLWLCNNAAVFFKHCKIIYTSINDKTPCSVFYKDECLFHNGVMKTKSLVLICEFYITHKFKKDSWIFDERNYYALNHENIEKFGSIYNLHKSNPNNIVDHTKLFYILYGYWNNICLEPIDGLIYTASNYNLIEKYGTLASSSLVEYFKDPQPKLTFCPYTYAASNYDKMEFIISNCKYCENESEKDRFTKHYLRKGYLDKLSINSFNKWTYLANNYKRIRALMPRNSKGKIIWDLYSLTSSAVAKDYLKRIHKTKKNRFKEVEFVKTFIDHDYVNKSKKLSLDNAAEYFVTYYVLSKDVRYNTSYISKIIDFVQGRAIDTMKQIPLNASRFVIETKCL